MTLRGPESVCLLIGRDQLADWKIEAFEQMVSETGATVEMIVRVGTQSERSRRTTVSKFRSVVTNKLITDPKDTVPLTSIKILSGAEMVYCEAEYDNAGRVTIPYQVVEKIVTRCDVVVHFGVGILTGDILTDPEYGTLSYHLGDICRYRGANVTLWMFLNDEPVGGVTLQQLTEDLDGGRIVALTTVSLKDAKRWSDVRQNLYEAAIPLLSSGIKNLRDPLFTPVAPSPEELGEMHHKDDVNTSVKVQYVLKELRGQILSKLHQINQ